MQKKKNSQNMHLRILQYFIKYAFKIYKYFKIYKIKLMLFNKNGISCTHFLSDNLYFFIYWKVVTCDFKIVFIQKGDLTSIAGYKNI